MAGFGYGQAPNTPSDTYEIVRNAVLTRRVITGFYQGHYREMCPHTIGWNASGEEQALFYQFGGASSSGLAPSGSPKNWRCVRLAGLTDVRVREGDWHTAPNHSRPQTCVRVVDVEVS